MIRYFLIYGKRLVKGESSENIKLVNSAFAYKDGEWQVISPNEINDRIMGYDPTEDDFYKIGNIEIMDSIEEITEEEAQKYYV